MRPLGQKHLRFIVLLLSDGTVPEALYFTRRCRSRLSGAVPLAFPFENFSCETMLIRICGVYQRVGYFARESGRARPGSSLVRHWLIRADQKQLLTQLIRV